MAEVSKQELREFVAEDRPGLTRGPQLGLRPGARVAVALPVYSPEAFVALVHTMSYACAVPVNPDYSSAELQEEMQGCEVRVRRRDTLQRADS